jgi:hypothetical protein
MSSTRSWTRLGNRYLRSVSLVGIELRSRNSSSPKGSPVRRRSMPLCVLVVADAVGLLGSEVLICALADASFNCLERRPDGDLRLSPRGETDTVLYLADQLVVVHQRHLLACEYSGWAPFKVLTGTIQLISEYAIRPVPVVEEERQCGDECCIPIDRHAEARVMGTS